MKSAFLALALCGLVASASAAPDKPNPPRVGNIPIITQGLFTQEFFPGTLQPTFQNPLKVDGADPCMFFYDGYYYLSTTTARDVKLRRAKHIGELKDAPDVQVWKDTDTTRDRDIWAPEFHMFDAKDGSGPRWYLYYTASQGPEPSHRMYVAQSAGTDPMGPYTFKAKLRTDADDAQYAIDGTIMQKPDGSFVFAWCGRPSPHGQGIYISNMSNPWTLTGERQTLEVSGFGDVPVREGPEFLQHGNNVYLVYSMCDASTTDYRLGAMVANVNSDLGQPASWTQYPKLLMARVDQNSVWGPGHCFFFKSPDGTQNWIAYHAKTSTERTFGDRSARAQPIRWRPDGTPDFGIPVAYETPVPVPSGEK